MHPSQWLTGHEDEVASKSAPGLDEAQVRLLIQFMSEIGAAMNGAGEATTFVRRTLQRVGRAYGLQQLGVFAVPTLLLLRYGDDRSTFVDLSSRIPADLRLDQTAALYELIEEAQDARISPAEGMLRLRRILEVPPRFPTWIRVAAMPVISSGIVLLLDPSPLEFALAAGLGLLVGLLKEGVGRWPQVWPLIPAAAGLLVGACVLLLIKEGVDCRPLLVIIPPLATFLPGAALTVSIIELSNGDIIAGGSRLAYGMIRLFLLIFGVVIAAQWIGLPATPSTPDALPYAALLSALGPLLFTIGVCLHFSAPKGSFPWLLLVVAGAWLGQLAGAELLGGYIGGFVGGAVMIVLAQAVRPRRGAPPLIVSFTPAFWLLVPGVLGLEGLAEIAQENPRAGVEDIVAMVGTMIAIALGVLFGLMVSGSARVSDPY
jgi:uncharacterized membrane protein YjjP (DUF1212 family)